MFKAAETFLAPISLRVGSFPSRILLLVTCSIRPIRPRWLGVTKLMAKPVFPLRAVRTPAAEIEERVNARAGAALLWPLLAIGVFSLSLWYWTDDLRLYIWVQFFPCLALPLLFLWCPPKYTGTFYWVIAAALYALAKLFEFYDRAVFSAGSALSGHTLKHLTAAAACFAILRYFQTRRLIA